MTQETLCKRVKESLCFQAVKCERENQWREK